MQTTCILTVKIALMLLSVTRIYFKQEFSISLVESQQTKTLKHYSLDLLSVTCVGIISRLLSR